MCYKQLKKRRPNSGLETNHYYCFCLFGATVILMFSAKLNIKTGQIGNVARHKKDKFPSHVVLQNKLNGDHLEMRVYCFPEAKAEHWLEVLIGDCRSDI